MRTLLLSLFAFYIILAATGCMPAPYFQKEAPVPQNAWTYNFKPSFTFTVTDSDAAYQPYFLIRHTQEYPYCNIWVFLYVRSATDSFEKKIRINVPLAENSGKWLGRGMGEIYEQRMALNLGDSITFRHPGTYTVSIEQNMRINPLPEVLNVGFRLEKIAIQPN